MKRNKALVLAAVVFLLLVIFAELYVGHQTGPEARTSSPLGVYGQVNEYCGDDPIPRDVSATPWIGCFVLSAGHSATGVFLGHQVKVTVDQDGQEAFTIDGTPLRDMTGANHPASETNFPFVFGGSGYSFCKDVSGQDCPSKIIVFSRNPDKSVMFVVGECFSPQDRVCVLTQKNWDYEKSRRH